MNRHRAQRCLLFPAVMLAGLLGASRAQAETFVLDADYSLERFFAFTRWPPERDYHVEAAGTNPAAPSGLTQISLQHGGRVAYAYYIDPCAASGQFTLSAPNGDELTAAFLPAGTLYDASGSWFITGGRNRFAGAQGGGIVQVEETRIRITGTASTPVPEPGTLLLLGCGAAWGLVGVRTRRGHEDALDP